MPSHAEKATLFDSLHIKGQPVVLFNIWDAGSAKAVAAAGAPALATGSASVAEVNGYADGEQVPLDLVLSNLSRIVTAVDVPVSLDFEGAYAVEPAQVKENVAKVIAAGAVGINFEDQIINGEGLHPIALQQERIAAARAAADEANVPFFINARTDIYLKTPPAERTESHLQDAIERAKAFAEAGASGLFAPGLIDELSVRRLCEASPLPVNILLMNSDLSPKQLADFGVARISYGPVPYRQLMKSLTDSAREAFSHR
jgi:2-methylisocitrate lyase-like PEP mutase family enzyme